MKLLTLKKFVRRMCLVFFIIVPVISGKAEEKLQVIKAATTSLSKSNSWIVPGQCTPPELWTQGIMGTLNPVLLEREKIVFDIGKGRWFIIELAAVDTESITIKWIWITDSKVLSGLKISPLLHSFSLEPPEAVKTLNNFKVVGLFNPQKKLLAMRLKYGFPRYALIKHNLKHKQGRVSQPAASSEVSPE